MTIRKSLPILCFAIFLGCKETPKKVVETIPVEEVSIEVTTPKSTYEDIAGNPIELSDYKGKKVFLNYWATWCRPCIEEMPAIERLQTLLEKENYVFLLASDQSIAKITKFKEARDFDFNYIKFNGALAEEQITALPVTIVYNEMGEQVARFDGGMEWDSAEIIQKLKEVQ
jgi:peroxiredoxin